MRGEAGKRQDRRGEELAASRRTAADSFFPGNQGEVMSIFVQRPRVLAITVAVLGQALALTGVTMLTACGGNTPRTSPPAAGRATVKVYLHKGPADNPAQVVAVTRTVPLGGGMPAAALTQLLAGPTAAERKAGYWSFFSSETSGMLRSAQISNGVARADFRNFSTIIPNASSSFGSAALLAELDATLKQFPHVQSTVYSFNGDVAAFYEWLQRVPPGVLPAGGTGAAAAASAFLRQVAGMTDLVAGEVRHTGTGAADVGLRPDSDTGPVTTVTLRQQADGTWVPAGAHTAAIRIDQPAGLQAVSSPVTIAGQSSAFEGQLSVGVMHLAGGSVTVLGRSGSISGGSMGAGPLQGHVPFVRPPTAGPTWLGVGYQSSSTEPPARATASMAPAGCGG